MAKYSIERICGHTDIVRIFGNEDHREYRIAQEEQRLCDECYQKERGMLRDEKNTRAAQSNKDSGLPALNGSERQVPWAETIRYEQFQTMRRLAEGALTPGIKAAAEAEIAEYMEETSAHKWIDRRFKIPDACWLGKRLLARSLFDNELSEALKVGSVAARIHLANRKQGGQR